MLNGASVLGRSYIIGTCI